MAVAGGGFWGGGWELIYEKSEKKYGVIEVRPEGYTGGSGSNITLNRQDMRSKFGYATLCAIDVEGGF